MPSVLLSLCLASCGGDSDAQLRPAALQSSGGDAPFCRTEGWFACHPWCFPESLRCDEIIDCPGGEDELDCDGGAPATGD